MRTEIWVGAVLAVVGVIFLAVGITFFRSSAALNQETDYIETLPVLSAPQLAAESQPLESVIQGQIAERNELFDNGFVAYIRSEYQGERCTEDDEGNESCESIWVEDERVTPALWLDLMGGRAQLANTNYELLGPPVTWQPIEALIVGETLRYEGFKIGNPVFAKGAVGSNAEGPTFEAEFIYGGDRNLYLADQRSAVWTEILGGAIFSLFGLAGLVAGGVLIALAFK